jgi:biotin transport system substrate-specific component
MNPASSRSALPARDLALVAVFAALIAALGLPGALVVVPGSAPVTMQTLGVMLAGSVLGARRGALAVLVFLVLVAAGLPLLAGGRGGLAVFSGVTAGFLAGWVAGSWVIGLLVGLRPQRGSTAWLVAANVVGGMGVVYLLGIPVMAWRAHFSLGHALAASAVYLPGDALKVALAAVVTAAVARGYPGIVSPARSSARDVSPEAIR